VGLQELLGLVLWLDVSRCRTLSEYMCLCRLTVRRVDVATAIYPIPYTLYLYTLIPYTLYLIPYTLIPLYLIPYTLIPLYLIPYTLIPLYPIPYTLIPYTLYPIPFKQHLLFHRI
jgi:hypothetical protein